MFRKVSLMLAILLSLSALSLASCDAKKKEEPKVEEKAKASGPEEDLLVAMKDVADILNKNKDDAEAAIKEVKAYSEKNSEKLKSVVEELRKKVDTMTPDEQDKFWEKNTTREEYQLWDGAMRRFEDAFPEKYAELEEATDNIQSAGTEDLIEETDATVNIEAILAEAQAEYKKLEAMDLSAATATDVRDKFVEIKVQAEKVEALYQTVFQNSQDPAVGVESLVKAADLYTLVSNQINDLPDVAGLAPEDLAASKKEILVPLRAKATELYGSALKFAAEKSVENAFVEKAKKAVEAAGTAPAPADGTPAPADGAPAETTGEAPAPN